MMTKTETVKCYRSLVAESLRLAKYGMKKEASLVDNAIERLSAETGIPVPDFFKKEREKAEEFLRDAYRFTGRKDKKISKTEIRTYAKQELGKNEALATRIVTDKAGYWLYRALLFKIIEPVAESEEWKIKITL